MKRLIIIVKISDNAAMNMEFLVQYTVIGYFQTNILLLNIYLLIISIEDYLYLVEQAGARNVQILACVIDQNAVINSNYQ